MLIDDTIFLLACFRYLCSEWSLLWGS